MERNTVAWRHRGLNPFTRCVDHRLQREEESTKLHSATSVLNPLPVIRGANHKGAEATAAADPKENLAAPAGLKAYNRMLSKDLFGLNGGVTGEQATAAMKAKQACNSKRKAEEQVMQERTNKRRLDAHGVVMSK